MPEIHQLEQLVSVAKHGIYQKQPRNCIYLSHFMQKSESKLEVSLLEHQKINGI